MDARTPGGDVIGSLRVFEQRTIEVGEFRLEWLVSGLLGGYRSGPELRWQRPEATVGDCTLLRFTPATCEPACTGVTACTAPDRCEAFPDPRDAGFLTVRGVNANLVVAGTAGSYVSGSAPDDLFDDDARVVVTLSGRDVPGHQIEARGVAPLGFELPDGFLTLAPGVDHVVRWEPERAGDARVRLTLNARSQARGQPIDAIIRCDVPDAQGSITVAAALIDAFPAVDHAPMCDGFDCPPSSLSRYHTGRAAAGSDTAELIVASDVRFWLDHAPAPAAISGR